MLDLFPTKARFEEQKHHDFQDMLGVMNTVPQRKHI